MSAGCCSCIERVEEDVRKLNEDRVHEGESDADVAQLAEQLTCNQQVVGSIPTIGSFK